MNRQSYYTAGSKNQAALSAAAADNSAVISPDGSSSPAAEGSSQTVNEVAGPIDPGQIPMIPLPNPGEGGPVADLTPPIYRPIRPGGNNLTVIIPGITFPCSSCSSNTYGKVRFINTSTGYPGFYIYLGNWLVASQLGNGETTRYLQATTGSQTVTVSGINGYVYVQKEIRVRSDVPMTVAIINTASGLDLMEISDLSCSAPSGASCLRVCNLSLNLGPFDVSVGSQSSLYTPFTNVRYKEVTPYTSFYPGWYQLNVSRTGTSQGIYVASSAATLSANTSYTFYIFNAENAVDGLKTMILSN